MSGVSVSWLMLIGMLASPASEVPQKPIEGDLNGSPLSGSFSEQGILHRTTAVFENTLNTYRLVLVELEPSLGRIASLGESAQAGPSTALPSVLQEVFSRLASVLHGRVAAGQQDYLARYHHGRAYRALKAIAQENRMGAMASHLSQFVDSLGAMVEQADFLVRILADIPETETRIIDQDELFDELGDALDEVRRGEKDIARFQKEKAGIELIAGAFRRTEVALGQVLDIWATAHRYGIDLMGAGGEDVFALSTNRAPATGELVKILDQVKPRLARLRVLNQRLNRRPTSFHSSLVNAEILPKGHNSVAVRLDWSRALQGVQGARRIRIYRQYDKEKLRQHLAYLMGCKSILNAQAQREVEGLLETFSFEREMLAELPITHAFFTEELSEEPIVSPNYSLVPISPFGVEGEETEVVPTWVPRDLEPVVYLTAEHKALSANDPSFYWNANTVTLNWRLSRSDIRRRPFYAEYAKSHGLPVVKSYRIHRNIGQGFEEVAMLSAGQDHWLDFPSFEQLAHGVRYRVEAVEEEGGAVAMHSVCTPKVQVDLRDHLRLAKAGAFWVQGTTRAQLQRRISIDSDPAFLGNLKKRFLSLAPGQRAEKIKEWWEWVASDEKRKMIDEATSRQQEWRGNESFPVSFAALGPNHLRWTILSALIAAQPTLESEIDRWWSLIGEKERLRRTKIWINLWPPFSRRWFEAKLKEGRPYEVQTPLRLWSWWTDRDSFEQKSIEEWWLGLEEFRRDEYLQKWYGELPLSLRWDAALSGMRSGSPKATQSILDEPEQRLPDWMWRSFLLWRVWHGAGPSEQLRIINAETGLWQKCWSWIVYGLRPLDLKLRFHLLLIVLISLLGGSSSILVGAAWLKKRQ